MKYILEWTETVEYRKVVEVDEPIRSTTEAEELVTNLDKEEFDGAFQGVPERSVWFTPEAHELNPTSTCPACGDPLGSYAMSRFDNKTRVCNRCGTFEALADFEGLFLTGPGRAEPA
jgi:transcription initiation factor IIE alpha subunit